MASRAQVILRGRFKPGTQVRLVKVRDERALRAEGGEEVGTATVDDDGAVKFASGVQDGARYFIVGQVDGQPLEVRARGRAAGDDAEVLEQAPVGPDRLRLSDGSFLDEVPERRPTPSIEVGPAPGQDQVPEGTVQRSDTPRGSAHPVDVELQEPVRRQEDVPDDVVQMSDTPTGEATEIVPSVQRQEDTPAGLLQRSDTPHGRATPIPAGDAIKAQQEQESPLARESRGEPTRAAAEPLGEVRKVRARSRSKSGPVNVTPGAPSDRDVLTGHDAQGQPADPAVAASLGIEPADKPVEAGSGKPKAAKPADPPAPPAADPPREEGASKTKEATTGAAGKATAKAPARRSTKKSAAKRRTASARKPAAKKKGS